LPANHDEKVKNKHEIRRQIHDQLRALWQDPPLCHAPWVLSYEKPALAGFTFLPIVCQWDRSICHLAIQIARVWNGGVLSGNGDLDNRIKTLIDGLRIPINASEIPSGDIPRADENPFCVLLENDALVNKFSVHAKGGRGTAFQQDKYYAEVEISVDVLDKDADI
jgi:hypothetical protein